MKQDLIQEPDTKKSKARFAIPIASLLFFLGLMVFSYNPFYFYGIHDIEFRKNVSLAERVKGWETQLFLMQVLDPPESTAEHLYYYSMVYLDEARNTPRTRDYQLMSIWCRNRMRKYLDLAPKNERIDALSYTISRDNGLVIQECGLTNAELAQVQVK